MPDDQQHQRPAVDKPIPQHRRSLTPYIALTAASKCRGGLCVRLKIKKRRFPHILLPTSIPCAILQISDFYGRLIVEG